MKTTKKYKFRIFKGSDMYCKLKIKNLMQSRGKGYLKWYNDKGEISSEQFESVDDSYKAEMIRQAEWLCDMWKADLVSY